MNAETTEPTWDNLPDWQGFNLLDKFYLDTPGRDGPYEERDFVFMAEFGFNFARLPIDYRTYMREDDPERFDETAFRHIDQAIEWGREYGVHISLNLHRIPGFTVAEPPEEPSLFEDDATLEEAARHWAFIARRYQDIPSRHLSFNLFNEPTDVSGEAYYKVAKRLCEAIREHTPDRLIICDGLGYGRIPVPELVSLKVAQATRGYEPFRLTHYNAEWVRGSHRYQVPTWPLQPVLNANLYGPLYPDLHNGVEIDGPFPAGAELILVVASVDAPVTLEVASGKESVFSTEVRPVSEEAVRKTAGTATTRTYRIPLPQDAKELSVHLSEGSRLVLDSLGIASGDDPAVSVVVPTGAQWDTYSDRLRYDASKAPGSRLAVGEVKGKDWVRRHYIEQWKAFREETGTGVIFGEFGAYNLVPHKVASAFVADIVELCEEAGFPWSLWELEGDFGIIASGRPDVDYETLTIGDYTYEVDRAMLNALLRASDAGRD